MSSHSLQNCPVCLESSSDLAAHMVNHPGVFIYKCGLCSDGFNRRPELHDHLKVHTSLGNTKPQNQLRRRVKPLSKKTLEARLLKKTKSAERKVAKKRGAAKGSGVEKQQQQKAKNIIVETLEDKGVVTKAVIIPEKEEESKEAESEAKNKTAAAKVESVGNIPHFMMIDASVNFEFEPKECIEKNQNSNMSSNGMTHEVKVEKMEVENSATQEMATNKKGEDLITSPIKSEVPLPVASTGSMSLRQRRSRRCRWHDNDSVCEQCDGSFIKTIAFERKQKKVSPTSSGDLSQLVGSGEDLDSLTSGPEAMAETASPVSTAN